MNNYVCRYIGQRTYVYADDACQAARIAGERFGMLECQVGQIEVAVDHEAHDRRETQAVYADRPCRTPFIRLNSADNIVLFEAEMRLGCDDTPGSFNKLVVVIGVDSPDSGVAVVSVINRRSSGDHLVTRQEVRHDALGNLLYGAARIETRKVLVPV